MGERAALVESDRGVPQLVWMPRRTAPATTSARSGRNTPGCPSVTCWAVRLATYPDDREPTRRLWTESVAGAAPMTWNIASAVRTACTAGSRPAGTPIRDSIVHVAVPTEPAFPAP